MLNVSESETEENPGANPKLPFLFLKVISNACFRSTNAHAFSVHLSIVA